MLRRSTLFIESSGGREIHGSAGTSCWLLWPQLEFCFFGWSCWFAPGGGSSGARGLISSWFSINGRLRLEPAMRLRKLLVVD